MRRIRKKADSEKNLIAGKQTKENVGIRKGQRLRIAGCATLLRCLVMAGFLLVLGPIPTQADDFQELGHGSRGEDREIRGEIGSLRAELESLRASVAALKSLIKTLQAGDNTTLQSEISSLQASNSALQKQLAAVQSNPALALGAYVSVDPNNELGVAGPHIVFSGANIHIESGGGSSYDGSGLGNLIIGYNEVPNDAGPGGPHLRIGAHNLVIGAGHRYPSDGGLVAGQRNTISGQGATVTGGAGNIASGSFASGSGGAENLASGDDASVSGGAATPPATVPA
jgi:hypothetical protein